MNKEKNPVEVFHKEAPEVAGAFFKMVESLGSLKTISPKMQQLYIIALRAAQGDMGALNTHIPMAKKAGATREEIKDVLVLTVIICGVQAIMNCMPEALEVYDKA